MRGKKHLNTENQAHLKFSRIPASIDISGLLRHLDGILAMALASGLPLGPCQLNFDKKPFVAKMQGPVGLGPSQHS